MKTLINLIMTISVGVLLSSCASMSSYDKTRVGYGAVGTGIGAGLGAVVGNACGHNTGVGLAIGAGAGLLAGSLLGNAQAESDQKMDGMQYQINTTTINVSNQNGSFTPVTLNKSSNGCWVGPRGEIYTGIPTPSQLSIYSN